MGMHASKPTPKPTGKAHDNHIIKYNRLSLKFKVHYLNKAAVMW